jgi:hypothetical protein
VLENDFGRGEGGIIAQPVNKLVTSNEDLRETYGPSRWQTVALWGPDRALELQGKGDDPRGLTSIPIHLSILAN